MRRIFAGVGRGASLATALHAPDPATAFEIICAQNGVPDEDAAKISLVVYLRSLGPDWREPERRVVSSVHEISGVSNGRPRALLLHRWNGRAHRFENAAPA